MEKQYNFAVVFKSSDSQALTKVKVFIISELDGRIIYSTGPSSKFLWVLEGAETGGGVKNEPTKL